MAKYKVLFVRIFDNALYTGIRNHAKRSNRSVSEDVVWILKNFLLEEKEVAEAAKVGR